MAQDSSTTLLCSRSKLLKFFGELDILRSEKRGAAFYVQSIARSKTNTLAFSAVQLQWSSRVQEPGQLRLWLNTLPELLRGALVWWVCLPDFVSRISKQQRQRGYWPFDQTLVC